MTPMTENQVRSALESLPPELHRLLLWLVTKRAASGSVRNGTA